MHGFRIPPLAKVLEVLSTAGDEARLHHRRQASEIRNVAGRVEDRRVAPLPPQCQGTTSEAARHRFDLAE